MLSAIEIAEYGRLFLRGSGLHDGGKGGQPGREYPSFGYQFQVSILGISSHPTKLIKFLSLWGKELTASTMIEKWNGLSFKKWQNGLVTKVDSDSLGAVVREKPHFHGWLGKGVK